MPQPVLRPSLIPVDTHPVSVPGLQEWTLSDEVLRQIGRRETPCQSQPIASILPLLVGASASQGSVQRQE